MLRVVTPIVVLALVACGGLQGHPIQSTSDVDGDGVFDVIDKCAYDPGPADNGGCPIPGTELPPPPPLPPPPQPMARPAPPPVAPVPETAPAPAPAPETAPEPAPTVSPATLPEPPPAPSSTTPPPYLVSDRDRDGITDEHDQCPDEPEDRDGVDDADGCPDP